MSTLATGNPPKTTIQGLGSWDFCGCSIAARVRGWWFVRPGERRVLPGFVQKSANQSHLRWVLTQFVCYDNSRRPRRSLDLRPPEGPVESPEQGEVIRRQVLGGLVNDYYRKAV
jgi:hypothetical protein